MRGEHFALPAVRLVTQGLSAFGLAPRNWGSNVTLLASMTREGMGACVAVEGPTTKVVFEAYVREALVPSLRQGQVVVMDNLSSHKGRKVRELIEGRGCELLVYLPPYPPDLLNPIERAFAKLKASLRRAQARTFEALIGAMGRALDAITARDASGFFLHCGYRDPAQLL
jgi:transposase